MITEISPLARVVLDGSGNGQVSLGPPSGTKWALRLATLEVSSAARQPQGFLYRGSGSGPIELVDFTLVGASASSGKVAGPLFYPGQVLWAKWVGGDAGATATLRAFGQQGARSDPLPPSPLGEGFPPVLRTLTLPQNAGPSDPRLVFGPDIPASLSTAAAARNFTVLAAEIAFYNATDYHFRALCTFTGAGGPYPVYIEGQYSTTNGFFVSQTFAGSTVAATFALWFFGDAANPSSLVMQHDNVIFDFLTTSDLRYNGASMPRPTVGQAALSTTNIGVNEVELAAFANFTFPKGRCYELQMSGMHTQSVGGNTNQFRLRKDYVSSASPGTDIGEYGRYVAQLGATGLYGTRYIARADTTDLTVTRLSLTATAAAGVGNIFTTAATPAYVTIRDVGKVDQYPQAFLIT